MQQNPKKISLAKCNKTNEYHTISFDILDWDEEGTVGFTVTVGGVEIFDEGYYAGNKTYTFEHVQATSTDNLMDMDYVGLVKCRPDDCSSL
jgi:hypothetical protein